MHPLTEWELPFITEQRVARLATIDAEGQPHVLPIVYAFDGERLYTPIDRKPKQVQPQQLKRVKNIRANSAVTIVIDEYKEDWQQLAWVQIHGSAEIVEAGLIYQAGIELLSNKYPQYAAMPLGDQPLIVVTPNRISSWRAGT